MIEILFRFIMVSVAIFGSMAAVGALLDIKKNHEYFMYKLDRIEKQIVDLREGKDDTDKWQ